MHAQVSHTQGEAHRSHQDLFQHMHDTRNAKPYCGSLRRRGAGARAIQEEALNRRHEASLDAHIQDSQQGLVPDSATVRDQVRGRARS